MSSKVGKDEMGGLPFIIAVDFDGTLVSDKFPAIGKKNEALFLLCKMWRMSGAKLVLWTSRHGVALGEAIQYCNQQGLYFDAYNKNIDEVIEMFGCDTRKVYADVYIDDKAVLPEAYIDAITRRLMKDAAREINPV